MNGAQLDQWAGVIVIAFVAMFVLVMFLSVTKPWRRHHCPRCNIKMPRRTGEDISDFVYRKTGEYFSPVNCHGRKCAKCSWIRFSVTRQMLGTWD